MTEAQILRELATLLQAVLGDDWDDDLEITRDTSFSDDLELESLELVDLAERMRTAFPGLDFATWLSGLELDTLMRLTVGEMVDFVLEAQPPE